MGTWPAKLEKKTLRNPEESPEKQNLIKQGQLYTWVYINVNPDQHLHL